ncbi:hypothetical protein T439DRAFT_38053 [Meredithblackwellia eburnea MCA 4105]
MLLTLPSFSHPDFFTIKPSSNSASSSSTQTTSSTTTTSQTRSRTNNCPGCEGFDEVASLFDTVLDAIEIEEQLISSRDDQLELAYGVIEMEGKKIDNLELAVQGLGAMVNELLLQRRTKAADVQDAHALIEKDRRTIKRLEGKVDSLDRLVTELGKEAVNREIELERCHIELAKAEEIQKKLEEDLAQAKSSEENTKDLVVTIKALQDQLSVLEAQEAAFKAERQRDANRRDRKRLNVALAIVVLRRKFSLLPSQNTVFTHSCRIYSSFLSEIHTFIIDHLPESAREIATALFPTCSSSFPFSRPPLSPPSLMLAPPSRHDRRSHAKSRL